MNDYTLLLYFYWALSPLCLMAVAVSGNSIVEWPQSKLDVWKNAGIVAAFFFFASWFLPLFILYAIGGYFKRQYKRYADLPFRTPPKKERRR